MSENIEALGKHGIDSFDTHSAMGEHTTKSGGDVHEFLRHLNEQNSPLEVDQHEFAQEYQLGNNGFFFRVYGARDLFELGMLGGIAISKDTESKECRIDGLYISEGEPALEGMYHLMAKGIIDQLSFTRMAGAGIALGNETSGLRAGSSDFNNYPNGKSILKTFGYEDENGWIIPMPRITVSGTQSFINDLLENSTPPAEFNGILAGDERAQYFEGGEKMGEMSKGSEKKWQLLDVNGDLIELFVPDMIPDSDLEHEIMTSGPGIRQLGYVSLLRARNQ